MTSYGGFLHYKVLFVLPRNESVATQALIEPDLILQVTQFLSFDICLSHQPCIPMPFIGSVSDRSLQKKKKKMENLNTTFIKLHVNDI